MTCFLKPGSCGDTKFLIWVSSWINVWLPDLYKKIFWHVGHVQPQSIPACTGLRDKSEKLSRVSQTTTSIIFRLYLRDTEVFLSQMGWIKTLWTCPRASFQLDVPGNPLEEGIQSHPRHILWANSSDSFYIKEQWHYFELTLSLRLCSVTLWVNLFPAPLSTDLTHFITINPYYSLRKLNRLSISCKQNSVISKD